MSPGRPTGTGWVRVGGRLSMIEIWENEVVGRNSGRAIYRCPVSGVPAPRGGYGTIGGIIDKTIIVVTSRLQP